MLLLMRRVGEMVRINKKITLQVKEIHPGAVTFIVEGLEEDTENEGGGAEKSNASSSREEH